MTETTASTEFGPRRTVVILAIVAGCFAILVPKIFYPMLTASFTPVVHPVDSAGCCDVIFESDVTASDIMHELCLNIIRHHQVDPRVRDALGTSKSNKLTPSSASLCREEVLAKCGIDLSSFLAEKERLKKSYKQVLEEIRGSNGSLCLKMQFGVPLARLGTPHLIRYHILMPHSPIRQERQTPPHAGSFHPALRERGRAIPSSHIVPKIPDRPDHVGPPIKMRPPMGGAGHVVAPPKGNGFVGLLMPLYTIGIVIFFLYTLSKVLVGILMPIYTVGNIVSVLYKVLQVLKKSSDSEIIRPEYSTANAEKEYQKIVFNPEIFAAAVTAVNGTQHEPSKHYSEPEEEEPAPTIDELKEHQAPKSNGLAAGVNPNSKDSEEHDRELEEIASRVQVVNMEMTATCEGGQRYSRPTTPTLLAPHSHHEVKEKSPPISIYLEGALPPQCELLVTDSKTQELQEEETVEVPVVLSGKMTLSLINLDQESQDELETEPAQDTAPSREETSSYYNRENITGVNDPSNRKVQVLKQEYPDKEDEYECDSEEGEIDDEEEEEQEEEEEEEEEESEEESFNENLLTSNRNLPYDNQSKETQETLKQIYVPNLPKRYGGDTVIFENTNSSHRGLAQTIPTGSSLQNSSKNETDEHAVNKDSEIEDETGEEEEDYEEEDGEEGSEEEDGEDDEGKDEEDDDVDEVDEDGEDEEVDEGEESDVEEEEEDDEEEYTGSAETKAKNVLESDSDDENEEENRKTLLKKPLVETKIN